jgi:hypothetical protein
MWGGNINLGALDLLVYLLVGVITLAIAAPIALMLIRRLNETWLDANWRTARRERQQNSVESIIVAKRDPVVASCGRALLIEAVFTMAGAGFGAIVYLPRPLDGWFFFSMIVFGAGGALLGLVANTVILLIRRPE